MNDSAETEEIPRQQDLPLPYHPLAILLHTLVLLNFLHGDSL